MLIVWCRFNGSSVQLYGGLYVDHGNYSVRWVEGTVALAALTRLSLDGVSQGVFNGTAFQLQTNVPRASQSDSVRFRLTHSSVRRKQPR